MSQEWIKFDIDTLTRKKSIRLKCLDCSNGSRLEVRKCPIPECPLYPYRMGGKKEQKKKLATLTRAK